jgi:Protein of unknown function (DUF2806)
MESLGGNMGFDIDLKDLAGISKPAQKLIQVVSAGIGSVFRPRSMRKEADAKAYGIRVIADAEADANVTKASGQTRAEVERIRILSGANPELLERAKIRLLSREIDGQLNIEDIAEQALANLPEKVSDQPISDDWKRKFFLEAENICDEDLQFLWGKVLAGEVTSTGSYSLRTLEVLKHLSKQEAELFRIACNLAFRDGWILKPGHDANVMLNPYGLNYDGLLSLRDAGLIYESDALIKQFKGLNPKQSYMFNNNDVLIQLSGAFPPILELAALPFTRAGMELQNLIEPNPCMPYLQDVAKHLRQKGLTVKKGTQNSNGSQTVLSFDEDL